MKGMIFLMITIFGVSCTQIPSELISITETKKDSTLAPVENDNETKKESENGRQTNLLDDEGTVIHYQWDDNGNGEKFLGKFNLEDVDGTCNFVLKVDGDIEAISTDITEHVEVNYSSSQDASGVTSSTQVSIYLDSAELESLGINQDLLNYIRPLNQDEKAVNNLNIVAYEKYAGATYNDLSMDQLWVSMQLKSESNTNYQFYTSYNSYDDMLDGIYASYIPFFYFNGTQYVAPASQTIQEVKLKELKVIQGDNCASSTEAKVNLKMDQATANLNLSLGELLESFELKINGDVESVLSDIQNESEKSWDAEIDDEINVAIKANGQFYCMLNGQAINSQAYNLVKTLEEDLDLVLSCVDLNAPETRVINIELLPNQMPNYHNFKGEIKVGNNAPETVILNNSNNQHAIIVNKLVSETIDVTFEVKSYFINYDCVIVGSSDPGFLMTVLQNQDINIEVECTERQNQPTHSLIVNLENPQVLGNSDSVQVKLIWDNGASMETLSLTKANQYAERIKEHGSEFDLEIISSPSGLDCNFSLNQSKTWSGVLNTYTVTNIKCE